MLSRSKVKAEDLGNSGQRYGVYCLMRLGKFRGRNFLIGGDSCNDPNLLIRLGVLISMPGGQ